MASDGGRDTFSANIYDTRHWLTDGNSGNHYLLAKEPHPFLHPNNREERNRIGERIRVLAHPFYDYVQWTESDLPGLRDFARRLKEEVDALVELLGND